MGRRAGIHWDKREQCYRTDAGGKPKYFRGVSRDDHAGAATAFAGWLSELAAAARPKELLVVDLCTAYVQAARGVKARTVQTHRERLLAWAAYDPGDGCGVLGGRPISSLTLKSLRGPLAAWKLAGWTATYRAGICRSVKAAFAWAATEEAGRLVQANPFAEVKVPTGPRSPERYATRREVAAFLRFAWRRASGLAGMHRRFAKNLILLVRIAMHCGSRPGELCAAWWGDFDDQRGTITLPPDRHKTGGKTLKNRVTYLTRPLVRALVRERNREGRHPVCIFTHKRSPHSASARTAGDPWGIFTTLPNGRQSFEPNSSPLSAKVRILREAAVEEGKRRLAAGLPTRGLELIQPEGDNRFVVYRLRHTTASDHLMSGGDPSTVAELLGTSPRMLETTYGHLLDEHLAKASVDLQSKRRSRGQG